MSGNVLTIADSDFKAEVLDATQLVLVYFWAAWCGPCRLMSPSINWAAEQFGDRLKIVKMEIDPNPQTVATYKVEGVPALFIFKDGQVVKSSEGAISKQKLEEFLAEVLPAAHA
ncbi:MAG TPA: thioredoxin family protein [Chroococcidiopsis sp.]